MLKSVEALAPVKILSKTFQSEDVDIIASTSLIERAKKQLRRIEKKDFYELPTVKRFLDKVTETEDSRYTFQDVLIKNFEAAKESVNQMKNEWVELISNAIHNRLEGVPLPFHQSMLR